MLRIGNGYDVHRLVEGRPLILCGVKIPHHLGLQGHSDADVATHAVTDALLGALALGDIGQWFPDNEARWKNADSLKMLRQVINHEKCAGCRLVNLDLTIIAQRPRLSPFIMEMRGNLAELFGVSTAAVSVKATTTERLGFCGREEGIAAWATLLVQV